MPPLEHYAYILKLHHLFLQSPCTEFMVCFLPKAKSCWKGAQWERNWGERVMGCEYDQNTFHTCEMMINAFNKVSRKFLAVYIAPVCKAFKKKTYF